MSLNGKKVFEKALNAIKFLDSLKRFRVEQNILGLVEGQGMSLGKNKLEKVFDLYSLVGILGISKLYSVK